MSEMDSNLGRAFYEVYCSSKEIIKSNQRQLFSNMLELLANTSKNSSPEAIARIITREDLFRFWIDDILPLLFNEDTAVQINAVSAVEQGLVTMDLGGIQNYSRWTGVKNTIINVYAPRINQLREDRSQYWHRIWCILIRILDREILKSASTINLFLSIVELGFRSPDNSVRAEAFTCWHLLIQIFAAQNQLASPKRLKLICIPLKSSQSKTPYVAAVKLRIWWYLITCLGPQLENHFENVVEPFLTYCWGSELRSTSGVAQQYVSVRELAVPCLAAIVTRQHNENLERLLQECELEALCQPSPTVKSNIMEKNWKSVFYAALEAIKLLVDNTNISEFEERQLNMVLKNITLSMIHLDMAPIYEYFCSGLTQMKPQSCRPIAVVVNTIAFEGLQFSRSLIDFDNYVNILKSLIKLLTTDRESVSLSVIEQFINRICSLDAFLPERLCWRAVSVIADYLFRMPNDEEFEYFEVKFAIWRHISLTILNCIKKGMFGRTAEEFIDVLILWSVWPLRTIVEFTGRGNDSFFDEDFYVLWHDLLQLSENTTGRANHLTEVSKILNKVLNAGYEWSVFIQLFNAYVNEIIKLDCNNYSNHFEEFFVLLSKAMNKDMPPKEKEKLLTMLRCVLHSLKSPQHSSVLDSIKATLKHAIRNSSKDVDIKFLEEWKQSILNILRSYMDKTYTNEVIEWFTNDMYVIIPSVWSLKPDKLTDRQKERLSEKTSIPALYNDMSQSQDALIQPWTPKKIVIAKEHRNEIVLDSSSAKQKGRNSQITEDCQGRTMLNSSKQIFGIGCPSVAVNNEKLQDFSDNTAKEANTKVQEINLNVLSQTAMKDQNINSAVVYEAETKDKFTPQVHDVESDQLKTNLAHSKFAQSANNHNSSPIMQDPLNCAVEDSTKAQMNDIRPDHQVACTEDNNKDVTNPSITEPMKDSSPKKTSTKNSLLLSPPDRKLTNNNSSPKLRPKPPAHLTGRGAQLINMIRNRKIDTPPAAQTPMPRLFVGKNDYMISDFDIVTVENTSTPLQTNDILTFSKRLPSPSASPSISILKRDLRRDSIDDISLESSACKKKRVSFHDPPVSVTKEYIKYHDENKAKPKRCLIMDKVQTNVEKGTESKCILRRRTKLDGVVDIEKFASQQTSKHHVSHRDSIGRSEVLDDENEYCLDSFTEANITTVASECLDDNCSHSRMENNADLTNANKIFDLVVERYTLEELIEKYLDSRTELKLNGYNTMTKIVSKAMSGNMKIKGNVLEILSENHSKDFLDHAIRENLASVVCDRLNLPSVIEYVCEKSKINTTCRGNLFTQIPDILKHCRQDDERLEFLQKILGSINLNDKDILDLINTLLRMRTMDNIRSTTVSEAAVDSSSNL